MTQPNLTHVTAHHPRPPATTALWFPLLPRARPPARALHLRVAELDRLARSASHGPDRTRLSQAAEVLNKAALLASDCGLPELARRLCWRQFSIFHAAMPLAPHAAKLALQPIINIGRLATRDGDGTRAYRIFEAIYQAITTEKTAQVDGRDIDLQHLVTSHEARRELRKYLWTILLADGTHALVRAGRYSDALTHIERHNGLGKRMLDGRQVAIIARCTTGDHHGALALLDTSSTPEPWEQAVAAYLRALSHHIAGRPATADIAAMIHVYLRLGSSAEHQVFRTRLGLSVIDLATPTNPSAAAQAAARVIREAITSTDAYSAVDLLSHEQGRSHLTDADTAALTDIADRSGLRQGTMPPTLLKLLTTSTNLGEAAITQITDQ